MSYIVAFVSYRDKDDEVYAVNCWRADVKPGDFVVVRQETKGGFLKRAKVVRTEFLNWKCQNYIECLVAEATFGPFGITLPVPTPTVFGPCRPSYAWDHLKAAGWSRHLTVSRHFKGGFSYTNKTEVANIFFRSNGIDIQLMEGAVNHALREDGRLSFAFVPSARVVRHSLSHSEINLFDWIIEFADAFRANEGSYDRFLVPRGNPNKLTAELREKFRVDRSENLYEALGGYAGEPVYLGDGLYLGPGDRWMDG